MACLVAAGALSSFVASGCAGGQDPAAADAVPSDSTPAALAPVAVLGAERVSDGDGPKAFGVLRVQTPEGEATIPEVRPDEYRLASLQWIGSAAGQRYFRIQRVDGTSCDLAVYSSGYSGQFVCEPVDDVVGGSMSRRGQTPEAFVRVPAGYSDLRLDGRSVELVGGFAPLKGASGSTVVAEASGPGMTTLTERLRFAP